MNDLFSRHAIAWLTELMFNFSLVECVVFVNLQMSVKYTSLRIISNISIINAEYVSINTTDWSSSPWKITTITRAYKAHTPRASTIGYSVD